MPRKWVLSSIITITLLASFLIGIFPAHADSVTVDTTSDNADGVTISVAALIASPGADGVISLREAMLAANNDPGPDTINFNIPGCPGDLCAITPTVALPVLNSGETTIDGFTQPLASPPSGAVSADIRIMILGSLIPNNNGIIINSADNIIKGLSIDDFPWYGVAIFGAVATGNEISGNHIGLNTSGTGGLGNTLGGVLIMQGASDNTIGGDTSSERNVISNNGINGVDIINDNSTGNVVSGNYIGLGGGGTIDLGNTSTGVFIGYGAHDNTIGGDTEGERNVISGNDLTGVGIHGGNTRNNTVIGNYIGLTRISGVAGNSQIGVDIYGGAHDNTIGGTGTGEGNVISGNGHMGIRLLGNADPALDTTGNIIIGNFIGTTSTSATTVGNGEHGILIKDEAHHNTVGGDTPAERNVISKNGSSGVHIVGVGSDGNIVSGNYIGTSVDGTMDRGNTFIGVSIAGGAEFNEIGGDSTGERNLISGNVNSGIAIGNFTEGAAHNNTIIGNYIGTDTSGLLALGNGNGVMIGFGSQTNQIGGGTSSERNVISGNGTGIVIEDTDTDLNVVTGNYIGVKATGSTALMNTHDGVWIRDGAQENTIGGDSAGFRNIISGNDDAGVRIEDSGSAHNQISGNFIGLDASGIIDLGNDAGVSILNGAQFNVIGGDDPGEGNVISGHNTFGVYLYDIGTDHNVVAGNVIGLDASGSTPIANDITGIWINSGPKYNIIGGNTPSERNVIAAFPASGVAISGTTSTYNEIKGNYIGTDSTGLLDRGGHTGINIEGGSNNTVGGVGIGEGNLISGCVIGINLNGSNVTLNAVIGNLIGTDINGLIGLANDSYGIAIQAGAHENTVGGNQATERNIIAGGGDIGVFISGIGTDDNIVAGNYIGMGKNGYADLGFAESGLVLQGGAQDNTIGGLDPEDRNLISGNNEYGVRISGLGTSGNQATSNYIGPNVSGVAGPGNDLGGVLIEVQATGNPIGPRNTITPNTGDGILVRGAGTESNTISENSIYMNSGTGISLATGGNTELTPPSIASAACAGPVSGTACASCTVEIFSDDDNEGRYYEGSAVANGSGNFNFAGSVTGPHLTATATDTSGNTSEFSSMYDLGTACNTPPTASFTASPLVGDRCTLFHFDASASSDFEDPTSSLEIRWDLSGDGLYDTLWSTNKTLDHRWLQDDVYTLRVQVMDTGGLLDTTTLGITVTTDPCQTFPDVPHGYWAWPYVEGIHAAGLTTGYPDGTYRPTEFVNRAQMAVFLLKGIHGASYMPPTPDGSHPFTDITGHWAEAWIEQLYDEGITTGFPDGTYRPADNVNRAQMAVMLLVAKHGSGYTPPASDDSHPFTDITGHWAEAWIEQLYDEGITAGYPDGTYRPADNVNRAQMAVFLVATFDLETP